MDSPERVNEILKYWFGRVENTVLPTQNRVRIWFGANPETDAEIRKNFLHDLEMAITREYDFWEGSSRGDLALIIILDQFSRNIYRKTPMAYAQDQQALDVCVRGIERQNDHELSLIERAFFYMPLMHAENKEMQSTSVRAFKMLVDLSFPEARPTYESFFEYALRHYEVVDKFGRFPHRNAILGRNSTTEEERFLETNKEKWGQ